MKRAHKYLVHVIQIEVKTPYAIKGETVENAINAALDEPPCDWEDWTVGGARQLSAHNTEDEC